jgi:hypothetical protein
MQVFERQVLPRLLSRNFAEKISLMTYSSSHNLQITCSLWETAQAVSSAISSCRSAPPIVKTSAPIGVIKESKVVVVVRSSLDIELYG